MTTAATSTDPVDFMREHAGFSYDPKTETREDGRNRCAQELAAAETRYRADADAFMVWRVDDIDSSDFDSENEPYQLWEALLCVDCDPTGADLIRGYDPSDGIFERPGKIVEALGGIDLGADGHPSSDPYARVITAELYAEFEAQRESAIVRGDN